VRSRGYATEDSEVAAGLRSVGVAVRDQAGWPVAAVAVTWADEERDERALADAVTATASVLESRLKR
jgi:DNA-binding IclR family transcriptional regulator